MAFRESRSTGPPATFHVVKVEGVAKIYGTTRALAGVSTTFEAGIVTVVQGPNGSGKSSLLQILAQLARPTRGRIRYGKLARQAARHHISLLAHAPLLYPALSADENLRFFARLHRVDEAAVERILARFGLDRIAGRPVRTYSRGQLQRVALARALLMEPTLLLLDEPSTGLDDASTERLASIVDQERKRGAIVVCVTHSERFAARIADRRIKLDRGKLIP